MASPASTELPAAAARDADDWFTPGRFLVLLALCLFAAFPEVILGSHTFYYRDFGHFAYPLAQYHRDCFWRGEIPLWNPYNSCGLPHLAQWNTMCLYPGALIYLLGPMPWALGAFSLAHLMLAGAGAYRLAQHWTGNRFAASVGGLAFAFNGFTLHAVMWPNNVAALAWAPWLWLLVERACKEGGRTVLPAALIGAMQMLTGAPEIILFTWGIAVPLALVAEGKRQKAKGKSAEQTNDSAPPFAFCLLPFSFAALALRFGAIIALVAALASAQLLPFLDLLRHSHRTLAYDDNLYAMPLWGWANFFVPLFRMTPDRLGVFTQLDQQWTSSYFPGLGVLALAGLAVWRRREPRVWILAVVAVLGVWLAMGQKAFLLDWLKAVFPPLGFIRFPIKYMVLTLMVLPFISAVGLAYLLAPKNPRPWQPSPQFPELTGPLPYPRLADRRVLFGAVTFLVLLVVLVVEIFAAKDASAGRMFDSSSVLTNASQPSFLLLALTTLLLAAVSSVNINTKLGLLVLFVTLFAADIVLHAPRQNPTVITQAYEPGVAKFSTPMPRLGEGRAMVSREMEGFMAHAQNADALNYCISSRRAAFANWNLLDGVPKVNGFFSQFPRELSDTWWLLYGHDRPFPERFADFLGITSISSSEVLFTWAHRTNALPLVTAGQEPIFANATNTLRALASADFNPAQVVYLPDTLRPLATATNAAQARVLSTRWSTDSVLIEVDAAAPAWVVLAQTYYHPWKAFVGERELPIHRANHAFQAVEIPAGRHTIHLQYVDRAFQLGVVLSLVGLLLCTSLWWRFGRTAP